MDTEQNTERTEQSEVKTYTAEEVEEMTRGLKAKVDELLGEKKTVSQRAKELEEAQAAAEQERLKEKEEFKTLWEREQQAKKELQEKYESFSKQIMEKTIASESLKLMSSVAVDDSSLELLAEKAQRYAVYTDGDVKYEIGGVQVEADKVIETLSQKYPRLVKGSGATGGGAAGAKGSGAAPMKRGEMTAAQKREFVNEHGQAAFLKLPK